MWREWGSGAGKSAGSVNGTQRPGIPVVGSSPLSRGGEKLDHRVLALTAAAALAWTTNGSAASAVYWNVFNVEGESALSADIVTYGALGDMLADQNRTGVSTRTRSGSGPTSWGPGRTGRRTGTCSTSRLSSDLSADIVTYGALGDMLADQNRTGVFTPNAARVRDQHRGVRVGRDDILERVQRRGRVRPCRPTSSPTARWATCWRTRTGPASSRRTRSGSGPDIVGSGADGTTYWNVFNVEGECHPVGGHRHLWRAGRHAGGPEPDRRLHAEPARVRDQHRGLGRVLHRRRRERLARRRDGADPGAASAADRSAAALTLLGWRARARS